MRVWLAALFATALLVLPLACDQAESHDAGTDSDAEAEADADGMRDADPDGRDSGPDADPDQAGDADADADLDGDADADRDSEVDSEADPDRDSDADADPGDADVEIDADAVDPWSACFDARLEPPEATCSGFCGASDRACGPTCGAAVDGNSYPAYFFDRAEDCDALVNVIAATGCSSTFGMEVASNHFWARCCCH